MICFIILLILVIGDEHKLANGFGQKVPTRTHSSELRGLHSTKCSSKTFQFKIYYILCIRKPTFIHKGKSKVAQDEKQKEFSLEHFIKHNILFLKSIIPQALHCKYGLLSEYLNFLHQKIRISFFDQSNE